MDIKKTCTQQLATSITAFKMSIHRRSCSGSKDGNGGSMQGSTVKILLYDLGKRQKTLQGAAIQSVHHLWKIKPASIRKREIPAVPAHIQSHDCLHN
jgi:hypothetical protein